MATLTDLQTASEGILHTFVDKDEIPDGYFGAMVFLDGDIVGYLLQGEQDNPEAVIKGRFHWSKADGTLAVYGFAGSCITGGTPLGRITSYRETFAQMTVALLNNLLT